MQQHISAISLVVPDYDEAIAFYTQTLNFQLLEDIDMGNGKRWVKVAPPGSTETSLLLAKAANEQQRLAIGNQTGGRVFLFLNSDDFWRDYRQMKARGVIFLEEPRDEPYAMVVVFQDPFGNRWDLLQPK